MSATARPRFLWKATSVTPRPLASVEIVAAGIAAVGGHLAGRRAATGDVAVEHGQEALGIGRVAGLDDDIEDQAALAGDQIELVAVLHVAAAFDDDVGVRLEQADQLFAGRHRLAVQHPAFALVEHARDQRQIMVDLGAPALGRDAGKLAQPLGGPLQRRPGGMNGSDQLAIEPAPVVFAATVLDLCGAALGHAPAIVPAHRRRPRQCRRLAQQPRHQAHGIPQQRAVARLVHQRRGNGAVDPHHRALFQLGLSGAGNQRPIDRLPGLGAESR